MHISLRFRMMESTKRVVNVLWKLKDFMLSLLIVSALSIRSLFLEIKNWTNGYLRSHVKKGFSHFSKMVSVCYFRPDSRLLQPGGSRLCCFGLFAGQNLHRHYV